MNEAIGFQNFQINTNITYELIILPVTFLQQLDFYGINCLFASSATLRYKFPPFAKSPGHYLQPKECIWTISICMLIILLSIAPMLTYEARL